MTSFYDYDETELNPNLNSKPDICMVCKKLNDPNEETLCAMNRMDQRGDDEFVCFAFENRNDS